MTSDDSVSAVPESIGGDERRHIEAALSLHDQTHFV